MLKRIQNDLFDLGADLCTIEGKAGEQALRIVPSQTERLEREIDAMNGELSPLTSFILPGGSEAAAWLHLGRTVARRAERDMTALAHRASRSAPRRSSTSTACPTICSSWRASSTTTAGRTSCGCPAEAARGKAR